MYLIYILTQIKKIEKLFHYNNIKQIKSVHKIIKTKTCSIT